MAFIFIASAVADSDSSPGTSLACSSPLDVAAGDLLVATLAWEDGTGGTLGVSDGASNIFTPTAEANGDAKSYKAFAYKLAATANAAATFTFTNSTSAPYRQVTVLQFRPDAGETVSLDPAASNPAMATAASGSAPVSGNITTEGTDTIAVGTTKMYAAQDFSSAQIGDAAAVGAGADGDGYNFSWYTILTATMVAGHAQVTGSTGSSWVCGIMAFKSVAAAPAITGTVTESITEADIVTGGKTIIITLSGDQWIAS